MNKSLLFAALIAVGFFSSCSKNEAYPTLPLSNYNLQTPGKYIIYQLDSLVFTQFGTQQVILSYFAKDQVDTEMVTDNLGRTAFRILHFISQSEEGPWQPDNTYLTIPTGNTVELNQDNLRFIKLHEPIVEGYSWKGNAYLDTYGVTTAVPGINDWDLSYLDKWDYTYQNVNQPLILGNLAIDSTITVVEQNNNTGPVTGDTTDIYSYSEINYGIEKYAKGIGLVYREFLYHQYQPPPPPVPPSTVSTGNGYSIGYGVTITMIDHN